MARNVAVIGLGSMGYGMASSILRAGHATWGVDVVASQEERFRGEGGQPGTLADASARPTDEPFAGAASEQCDFLDVRSRK